MLKVLIEGCEPTRGTKYSACIDLYASEDVVIGAGETKLVGLGVCIDIDHELMLQMVGEWIITHPSVCADFNDIKDTILSTHYLQLMLRSSLGKKGLILPNGIGIIDLDYRDEIKMIIYNPITANKKHIFESKKIPSMKPIGYEMILSDNDFKVKKGDKIAQITLLEHKGYLFGIETEKERDGGFGSTGEK